MNDESDFSEGVTVGEGQVARARARLLGAVALAAVLIIGVAGIGRAVAGRGHAPPEPDEIAQVMPQGAKSFNDAAALANAIREINGQEPTSWTEQRVVERPWMEPELAGVKGEDPRRWAVLEAADGEIVEVLFSPDGTSIETFRGSEYLRHLESRTLRSEPVVPVLSMDEARARAEAALDVFLDRQEWDLDAPQAYDDEHSASYSFWYPVRVNGMSTPYSALVEVSQLTGDVVFWGAPGDPRVRDDGPPTLSESDAVAIAISMLIPADGGSVPDLTTDDLRAELAYAFCGPSIDYETGEFIRREPVLVYVIQSAVTREDALYSGSTSMRINAHSGEWCN